MNSEGANGPLDQRDDYKEAKKICNRLSVVTQKSHPQEQVRQRPDQQFEVHEEDSYRIDSGTG